MEDTKVIEATEDTEDRQVTEEPQEGEVIDAREYKVPLPHPYKDMDYEAQEVRLFVSFSLIAGHVFEKWMLKPGEDGRIQYAQGRKGGFLGTSMEDLYNNTRQAVLKNPPPELAEAVEDYQGLRDIVKPNYEYLESELLKEKDISRQVSRAIYLYGLELYDPKNKDHEAWRTIRAVNIRRRKEDRDPYPFSGMDKALVVTGLRLLSGSFKYISQEARELLKSLEPAIIARLGKRASRRLRHKYSPVLSTVTSGMEGAAALFYPATNGSRGLKKLENPEDFKIARSVLWVGDQEVPARIKDIRTSQDLTSIPKEQYFFVRSIYSLAKQSRELGIRGRYELLGLTERELEDFTGMNMRSKWSGKPWAERLGGLSGLVVELEDGGIYVMASLSRYEPATKEYFIDVSLCDKWIDLMEEYHTRKKDGKILPHHLYAFLSDKRIVRDNPDALMVLERIMEGVARMGMDTGKAKRRAVTVVDPGGESFKEKRWEWTYSAKFSFLLSDERLARVKADLDKQPTLNAKNTFLRRLVAKMQEIVDDASDLSLIYRDFKIILPEKLASTRLDKEVIVKHTGWREGYRREVI